ncbi:hypothetical protein Z950_488 [Sulfitobacter mediterraneus KCTC 32188]|nr:hypothetical protein Z950_488 [Sulfitobacter mediterraneus KCTC 32188]
MRTDFSATLPRRFNTRSAVAELTPASRATSWSVGLFIVPPLTTESLVIVVFRLFQKMMIVNHFVLKDVESQEKA